MSEKYQIYRCGVCGNVFEVVHAGTSAPVCCGETTEPMLEKTDDVGLEKHVPLIEKVEDGVIVRVGEIPHPMEEVHYIEWIQVIVDEDRSYRKFLHPGDKPEAKFEVSGENIRAREFCNIHGLWVSKNEENQV